MPFRAKMRILSLLTLQFLTALYVQNGGDYLELIESRDIPTHDFSYGTRKLEVDLGKKRSAFVI